MYTMNIWTDVIFAYIIYWWLILPVIFAYITCINSAKVRNTKMVHGETVLSMTSKNDRTALVCFEITCLITCLMTNILRTFRSTIDQIEKSWGKNARTFGISKSGLTRAILHFKKPPESHPMTVCFHFPSIALTHVHVIRLMTGLIGPFRGSKVTSLQFVDRNVVHGTRGLDNRWLVTLNTNESRDYLVNSGLPLFNRVVDIKLYDDVMHEEHESFLRYSKYQKHLNPQLKEVTNE